MKKAVVCALSALGTGIALGQVSFPDLFKDHAIVQRDAATAVWGRAEPGEQVRVALGGVAATAKTGADGWWLATLDTSKLTDGPFVLEARAPSGTATSQDILVGEVWLAAGQSNMEFTMKGGFGPITDYAKREAVCARRPIRMFRAPKRTDSDPFKGDAPIAFDAKGTWRVISPETLGSVTAVGYTFIDTLQRTLGCAAGVVDISWSGTRCWAWMPRARIDAHPELAAEFRRQSDLIARGEGKKVNKPVIRCWNNQFAPVSKMSCRGVIWYQGCCDSGLADARHVYPKWMSYMVEEWRREMGKPNLPFLYCQLAGWGAIEAKPEACPSKANLREGQRRAQKLIPNSAMAVILDNSEYEIHGRFKGAAGDRLAWLALNRVYGLGDVVCASPDYASATFSPDAAVVRFETTGVPLVAKPIRTSYTWNAKSNDVIQITRRSTPESQLEGFTIRDGAGRWHWADARIVAPDAVKVWAAEAKNPTAVRYNMRSQGFGNLYNLAGLPASCFTTEE
ncbi:MAG: sialate O-acetylesterase [Kiritimatiellia bacterium]